MGEGLADARHREGEDAAGRQDAGERDDEEVRADAEGGELAELGEHHRRDAELSTGGCREDARDRPRTPARKSLANPRPQMEEPGGRRERELEARLGQASGLQEQQREERRREAVPHATLAAEEARGQEQAAHDGRAQHRRLAADDRGERDQRGEREAGGERCRKPHKPEEEEGRAGHQCDVEAGDREYVVDARAAEVRQQGRRQLATLPDEEPLEQRAGHGRQLASMTAWIQKRVRSHQGTGTGVRRSRLAGRAVAR